MDLSHYNHVFNLPNGLLVGERRIYKELNPDLLNKRLGVLKNRKIAPKRSSLKQTMIDFALGMLYWATFIAIGLLITC